MKKRIVLSFVASVVMSLPATAAQVLVLGHSNAPMFTKEGSGREGDVITTVLERCGHSVKFDLQPFTRHWKSFKAGKGDAVTTVPIGMNLGGTSTAPYFFYQNGISTLVKNAINANDLGGLSGKRVVAFKGATNILGDLKSASKDFAKYRETSEQEVQSQLLFMNRVDAVIGDGMIFAEYTKSLQSSSKKQKFDPNQAVEFKAIFDPSPRAMTFRDAGLAADFDRCFAESVADGAIAKINKKWTDMYRDVLGSEYLGY